MKEHTKITAIVDVEEGKVFVARSPTGTRHWCVCDITKRLMFKTSGELTWTEIQMAKVLFDHQESAAGWKKRFRRKKGKFVDVLFSNRFGLSFYERTIWMSFFGSHFKHDYALRDARAGVIVYTSDGKKHSYSQDQRLALTGSIPFDRMWNIGSMVDVIDLKTNKLLLTYRN